MTERDAVIREVAAPVRPAPRVQPAGLRRPARWTLPLFGAGLVLGVAVALATAPATRANPFPSLAAVAEPDAAGQVASALAAEDARALGRSLDGKQLQALGEAIQPVATVFDCLFTGAVAQKGEILAAYVVKGRDRSGGDVAVGFVLHVRDGKVVGVN